MSPNGKGMANIKGVLVFIPNGKLGEHLTVKITNIDAISAEAEIINQV
ncbi:TRAM domain-containing protein [Candidatus Bathyarchaeota archaeon]|nr:TRAM domain-containing protein [Candidatus Bathyarchaeota archaeon]